MALLCYLLFAFGRSAVDAYTLGKEISELSRFQHQSGGFYDITREANGRDTFRATWVASIYGAFQYFDVRATYRWFQTCKNRDGGAGITPGARSSVYATYCYFHTASLIAPDHLDVLRLIDFLKSCYDPSSGLFRDTIESEPSIEATYYAYELLHRFRDSELNWLQPYVVQAYINDHLFDDHFQFDGISSIKAQLFAGSVAKHVSSTIPYHRISQYIVNEVIERIKNDDFTNEDAAAAAQLLSNFADEAIPDQLIQWIKTSGSLADLFYINQILVATGEISKFFEIQVLSISMDNQVIDFEKEGITYQQLVHPAVIIRSLGRFYNPMLTVNVTTHMGDASPTTEQLKLDYQTGLYTSQRFSSASTLGRMQIDVVAFLPNDVAPIFITKTAISRVSLPLEITCESWLHADEIIPVGGEVQQGVTFHAKISGKTEDLQINEGTAVTFQVVDPSGAVLYHQFEDYKDGLEFTWVLSDLAIPVGNLLVSIDIGDNQNGVHTKKDFEYKITGTMAATNLEIPTDLKLSDILHVKMTPAFKSGEHNVPFTDKKIFEGDLKDATGESFFPQTQAESQRYLMQVSVGDVVVKTIDGEVTQQDGNLVVEFETNVNENLDFATGFKIAFQFQPQNSEPVQLECDQDTFVRVSSKLVYEGTDLLSGSVEYGRKINIEFVLKDQDTGKLLDSGYSYPVIVIRRQSDNFPVVEKKANAVDDKYTAKIKVNVAVENGEAILAVMIRKGNDLVPVLTSSDKPAESKIAVTGEIGVRANVSEAKKYVVVDFETTYKGKKIGGAALKCNVIDSNGAVIAELPLAQMKNGISRLSWVSGDLKGQYKLQLYRLHSTEQKPFYEKTITVEHPIVSIIHQLPIEGITLCVSFLLFVWSIYLRKGVESR